MKERDQHAVTGDEPHDVLGDLVSDAIDADGVGEEVGQFLEREHFVHAAFEFTAAGVDVFLDLFETSGSPHSAQPKPRLTQRKLPEWL